MSQCWQMGETQSDMDRLNKIRHNAQTAAPQKIFIFNAFKSSLPSFCIRPLTEINLTLISFQMNSDIVAKCSMPSLLRQWKAVRKQSTMGCVTEALERCGLDLSPYVLHHQLLLSCILAYYDSGPKRPINEMHKWVPAALCPDIWYEPVNVRRVT